MWLRDGKVYGEALTYKLFMKNNLKYYEQRTSIKF